jgi:hypothetical protein
MNVVETQIAVAIENPVLLNAFMEQVFIQLVELVCVMANRLESGGRNCLANERLDLSEILVGADLQLFGCAPLLDLRHRSFRLIESMQGGDHAVNLLFADQIFLEQFVQEAAMRQFFHIHGVIDDFPRWFEREAGISLIDGNSVEINFRTESSIQFNLALAKVVAFFQRAEIEKTEIHRLLHFEDKRRRNKDP